MRDSGSHEYRADYNALRAPVGCDLAELKRCYWRELRLLHPDRNPELANDASAQASLSQLNVAYRRLLEYHKAHDRLPGSRQQTPRAQPESSGGVDRAPPAMRRTAPWLAVFAVLSAGALWMIWPVDPERDTGTDWSPPETTPEPVDAVEPTPSPAPTAAIADYGNYPERDRGIRIGDTKATVRSILGRPILSSSDAWEYGPSHVRFQDGRVIDWYSSPLKPLRVDEASRAPAEGAHNHAPAGGH
jgi:hypothetical protein